MNFIYMYKEDLALNYNGWDAIKPNQIKQNEYKHDWNKKANKEQFYR